MLIKIIKSDKHFAQNGPTGIRIHTGTRYFAAVLLQEWFEFIRYAFWFWGVPVAIFAVSGGLYAYGIKLALWGVLAGVAFMVLVGSKTIKFADRELNGQAIEIAAIKLFYERKDMESEYRLQARSMVRSDSPYMRKGYWPDIEPVDPNIYANTDAINGTYHPSIERMVSWLKAREPFAERYVKKHRTKLEKWKPLGPEGLGY